MLALVGESGCGKTTLARTILGLQRPDAGQARFRGEPVRKDTRALLRRYRREVQMDFPDPTSTLNARRPSTRRSPRACGSGNRLRRGAARRGGARARRAAAARALLRPLRVPDPARVPLSSALVGRRVGRGGAARDRGPLLRARTSGCGPCPTALPDRCTARRTTRCTRRGAQPRRRRGRRGPARPRLAVPVVAGPGAQPRQTGRNAAGAVRPVRRV
ncbi:MAG: ATP-binding cassette domain-containing protein, partial [Chloroflexota bacterium]